MAEWEPGVKPYYADEWVTLYHGDCRDVLPAVVGDAVVTDPPYNVGIQYGRGTDDTRADYEAWCREWFGLLRAACAGPIAITCGQANVSMWATIAAPDWWLAWWKPAAMGRCVVGFNNWEPIALYGKPLESITDVIRAPIVPDASVEGHPCPKPLEWAAKQIGYMTKPGQTVIEPFSGTGTTLRAAKDMNRKAIGIEIEERYCEIAAQRCSQEVLGLSA
jgi:site-specific DNA-methyltransferase (adenine-specific)